MSETQTFSSEPAGLREAAAALTERRERGGEPAPPPPPERKPDDAPRTLQEAQRERAEPRRDSRSRDDLVDGLVSGRVVDTIKRNPDFEKSPLVSTNPITGERQIVDPETGDTLQGVRASSKLLSAYRADKDAWLQGELARKQADIAALGGRRPADVTHELLGMAARGASETEVRAAFPDLAAAIDAERQQPSPQQPMQSQPGPAPQQQHDPEYAALDAQAGAFMQRHPDVRSIDDLKALAQRDPGRAQAIFEEARQLSVAAINANAKRGIDPEVVTLRQAAAEDLRAAKIARTQQVSVMSDWLKAGQAEMHRHYPDIRSQQDLNNLRISNPQRAVAYEAHAAQINQAVDNFKNIETNWDKIEGEQRRYVEAKEKADFERYARNQEAHLIQNLVPELGDRKTAEPLQRATREMLLSAGYSNKELNDAWGKDRLLRDARTQAILVKAVRDSEKAAKYDQLVAQGVKPASKPIPQVQQPGVARPAGAAASEDAARHSRRLDRTGSIKDATRLLVAKRAARGGY